MARLGKLPGGEVGWFRPCVSTMLNAHVNCAIMISVFLYFGFDRPQGHCAAVLFCIWKEGGLDQSRAKLWRIPKPAVNLVSVKYEVLCVQRPRHKLFSIQIMNNKQ